MLWLLTGLVALALILLVVLLRKVGTGDRAAQLESEFGVFKKDVMGGLERLEKNHKDEFSRNRTESTEKEKSVREENLSRFKEFSTAVEQKLEKVREVVEQRLEAIQKDNGEKLEKMRVTVDEKLHETLEKRLGESFKLVGDRLEQVHKGLGEMQTLASGVGDLKKVLQNVKTRGTWGEVQLDNLLEQLLTPDQYAKNVAPKKGSGERVEFAIKIPAKDEKGGSILLPVDAKFPLEDYQKLIDAQERGDIAAIEQFSKALEQRVKTDAKNIREKYLNPPHTTDFGVMYLPIEGLFAEIIRRPGLMETLQKEYRVMVAGPTTFAVILNSLQMGFRTLAIQKRSSEVWAVLATVKKEFGKFGDLLEKTHKKLQEASNTIEDATTKSRTLERKLDKVQELPASETNDVLASGDEAN